MVIGLEEFLEEPKREDVERGLARFLEKRRWSGMVCVRLKASARTLYFDCALNAIVKSDEVVGVSALARDVTEEREKERRFTELFETLQEGVYFSTPEGKFLDGNAALMQILGYESKEEFLALDPRALNSDLNHSPVLGRTADDQGGVRTREITLRRKDGRLGIFLDTSRAVWDADGKIVRYQGTLVDVTERREMEKALRRQEEFQRYLLESFPDLILVIDLQGRYSFVSSRIHDLRGFKPEDLLGKKVEEEQDYSAELLGLYRDLTTGRKMFGFCDYNARHRDGSWRNMRASASPLFDAENKLSGVIVSVRDITVEKKLEQQIIQSERLAAMGQMIGGFAHELNNPLTSILGMSELLQEGEATESVRRQMGFAAAGAAGSGNCSEPNVFLAATGAGQGLHRSWRVGATDPAPARVFSAQEQHHGRFPERGSPAGERRFPSTDAGVSEPHIEFGAGDAGGAGSRHSAYPPGKRPEVNLSGFSGRWPRNPAGDSAQHFRSFLHDQATGTGNGARVEYLQGDSTGAQRECRSGIGAGWRRGVQSDAAGGRQGWQPSSEFLNRQLDAVNRVRRLS